MTDQGSETKASGGGMGQFVVKAIVAGVILVAGVAGGIYTGTALNRSQGLTPNQLRNTSFLDIGDPFPDYTLWEDERGAEFTVSEAVADGPALFLFVSYTCSACHTMMKQWEKRVLPELDPGISLYLVYDDNEVAPEGVPGLAGEGKNIHRVTTNREKQRDEDGISATPTLVAVGTDGKIKFISTGYVREVDAAYIAEHL